MSEAKMYETKIQKVKIAFTVEVDANMIKEYIKELGTNETVSQFIKSHMQASAIGVLEENLLNNGYGYNTVEAL
tara:strand:+ start:288 stop:509 length:222 start_codon:yes stop_codon:yes gene_type:complete